MNSDYTQQPHERNSSAASTPPLTEEVTTAFEFRNQGQEDGKNSDLTIKLPSSDREVDNGGEGFGGDDEPRTPTSSDQKIPVTTACPPAPRKPKSVPISNYKRKTRSFQRISVDLSVILNAMCAPITVPDFLAGDLDAGDHSKKVKKANVTTGS